MTTTMPITALAPWFGGNRANAAVVGQALGPLRFCAVLCCGGLPELPHIETQAGIAVDRHRHMINLARVVADDQLLLRLIRRVDRLLYHDDVLAEAQARCRDLESALVGGLFASPHAGIEPDVTWAAYYFVCCWMGRGGYAGRGGELPPSIAVRYSASGGSSARRWRSAVESLPAWGRVLSRWQFVCGDLFDLLQRLQPQPSAGVYADPPWVDLGDEYEHRFSIADHRRLASELDRLGGLGYRVVVRYGDHPLIRSLYPEAGGWRWSERETRNQQNGAVHEVLIVRGGEGGHS